MTLPREILVPCGGESPERDVSLESGAFVVQCLRDAGFDARMEDVRTRAQACAAASAPVDLFFPMFHGGWGEDGRFQALLEMSGRPFVGSASVACSLAMDKWLSKILFDRAGLRTPHGGLVSRTLFALQGSDGLLRALERYGRLVVKPRCGGSTVGTSAVGAPDELYPALEAAWAYSDDALVEEYIPGMELTVGLYDDEFGPRQLPPLEIVPASGFYDYRAKYTDGASDCHGVALPPDVAASVIATAGAAWTVLGLRDLARMDLRLSVDGDPVVLECNATPGMRSHSLVPLAITAAGFDLPNFLARLVTFAWEHGRRN